MRGDPGVRLWYRMPMNSDRIPEFKASAEVEQGSGYCRLQLASAPCPDWLSRSELPGGNAVS